jgi:chromosome condensin MukBEF MukE localization factor
VNLDMMKAMRVLENLSGEKLVHKADLNGTEILEENTKKTSLKEQLTLQNQRIKDQDLLIQKLTERINQLERNTKTN